MSAPLDSYTATATKDGAEVNEVSGLSIDGARHLAAVHAGMGFEAVVQAEHSNYHETYSVQ